MGARSILIKEVFFPLVSFPRLGPLLMAARRGRRSAAAATEREVKRARYHPNKAAGSGRATSGVPRWEPSLRQYQFQPMVKVGFSLKKIVQEVRLALDVQPILLQAVVALASVLSRSRSKADVLEGA